MESGKRFVKKPGDLIFYTDTDNASYPVFITAEREVWLKARPYRKIITQDKWGHEVEQKLYDVPIVATFFVKNIAKTNDDFSHQLLETTIKILEEVTKNKPAAVERLEIVYEVYKGDMERLLGEVKAYCIKVISAETPFSGAKYADRKAWAVGFDWKKRVIAKCPELEPLVYLKGMEGSKGRAYVQLVVKLPVATQEFENMFNAALADTSDTEVSISAELEEQINALEEMIKRKEEELEALRKELETLKLKLSLERTKRQLITS